MKFKEWFENKLVVGGYPAINEIEEGGRLNHIDIFVNVSDEFILPYHEEFTKIGKTNLWFPMNEAFGNIGLHSMFGALQVLFYAYKNNKSVYLHCHAGINRSPTIQCAFYYLMTAEHLEAKFGNRMKQNIKGGHLPSIETMELWLKKVKICFEEPEKFLGGMLDYTFHKSNIQLNVGNAE